MAYAIDGDLSDWGLTELTNIANWGTASSWVPDSPAYYKVEDNEDPDYGGSYTGIHIQGPPQATYNEPKIQNEYGTWVKQPYGGEHCDIEALYFDRDPTLGSGNVYIAIMASYDPSTNPVTKMGDLRIILGGSEYGIIVIGHDGLTSGAVYENPNWIPTQDPGPGWIICPHNYYRIDAANPGSFKTLGTVVLNTNAGLPNDKSKPNYVIEISAQKSAFNNPESGDLQLTMWCANDRIELEDVNFEIPEFTTIAIPVAMILGLFYFFRRKRES